MVGNEGKFERQASIADRCDKKTDCYHYLPRLKSVQFLYVKINPWTGHTSPLYDKKLVWACDYRGMAYAKLGNYKQAIEDKKIAARLGLEEAQDFLERRGIDW
ncbi:MAG: hypothetical protein ABSE05_16630 [Syntrophales bacterium]|jgi:hypothetical protein